MELVKTLTDLEPQLPPALRLAFGTVAIVFFGTIIYLSGCAMTGVFHEQDWAAHTFVVTEEALICESPKEIVGVPWDQITGLEVLGGLNPWNLRRLGGYRLSHTRGSVTIDYGLPDHAALIETIVQRVIWG